jgi:uncharacterized membrane protein
MNPANFITAEQKKLLQAAIAEAEKSTSGEIRIHIEKDLDGDILDRAAYLFRKLEMHKTELRNGVLIYLALAGKKFAIIGDAGINSVVAEDFWDGIKDGMSHDFSKGEFTAGLICAVQKAGEQLANHFPIQKNDRNELSNEISFGKS